MSTRRIIQILNEGALVIGVMCLYFKPNIEIALISLAFVATLIGLIIEEKVHATRKIDRQQYTKLKKALRSIPLSVSRFYPELKWIVVAVLGGVVFPMVLSKYMEENFNPSVLKTYTEFITAHYFLMLIIVLILVLFFLAWIGHGWRETEKRIRAAFTIFTPAQELRLEDLDLEKRPFGGKYFPRKAIEEYIEYTDADTDDADTDIVRGFAEENLEQFLRSGQGFLLIGPQWSGKTMTIFQILKRMVDFTVISPAQTFPDRKIFDILKRKKVVIVLDNLSTFPETYDLPRFKNLVAKATQDNYAVAAACRDGNALTKIMLNHGNHVSIFCEGLPKLRLREMTIAERIEHGKTDGLDLDWKTARNYPLPGMITMREMIQPMVSRFPRLPESNQDVLRAIKLLDTGGVSISVSRLQIVLCDVFNRSLEQSAIKDILWNLREESFLFEQQSMEMIDPNFGYIEIAVSYEEGAKPRNKRWDDLAKALEKIKDVEALLYLSYNQGRLGDHKRALQTLDAVLWIDDKNAQGYYQRGYTLVRLRKYDEALEANTRALELRPELPEALNNRGYILYCLGKLTDSEAVLRHVLELSPNYDDAHTNLARVLVRTGRSSEAIQEIHTALGIRKENHYAYLNMAIILSRENELDEALIAIEKALRIRPEYPEAYEHRGIILAKNHQYEEALKAHDKAIAQREEYAEAHMHRGETLFHLDRYEEAVKAHSRAIKFRDDYALAYANRGITYTHMGKEYLEQAKKDGQKALTLGVEPLTRVLGIAKFLGINGALIDALAMINDIIAADPEYPEAHLERGITLAHMGPEYFDEALADFDKTLEYSPDNAEAYLNRARMFVHMGPEHFDKALADFDKTLEYSPDNAEAYLNRGITLARLHRFDDALADFAHTLKLRPDNDKAYMNVARMFTHMDSERFEKSLASFDKIFEFRSDNTEACLKIARIFTYMGPEYLETVLALNNRAIEIRPNYTEALFEKARTLCFLARRDPQQFPLHESFGNAMDLLEHAITIDNSIIALIKRDCSNAFLDLLKDPDYGPRLTALVQGKGH